MYMTHNFRSKTQLQGSRRREASQQLLFRMKFVSLLCLLPLALGDPEAHGYGYTKLAAVPKCQTTYQTITENQCTTVATRSCSTEEITTTQLHKSCDTTTNQECTTISRQVSKPKCTTTPTNICKSLIKNVDENVCEKVVKKECTDAEQCTTEFKTVYTTVQQNECTPVTENICTVAPVTVPQTFASPVLASYAAAPVVTSYAAAPVVASYAAAPVVASYAATPAVASYAAAPVALGSTPVYSAGFLPGPLNSALRTKRDADAEAKADAHLYGLASATLPVATAAATRCQAVTRNICRNVAVQVPSTVAVPKCVNVPNCVEVSSPECEVVPRAVTYQQCDIESKTTCNTTITTVPETRCVPVPITKCQDVSVPVIRNVERCADVPKEVCKAVNRSVPQTICAQPAVAIATPAAAPVAVIARAVKPVAFTSKVATGFKGTQYSHQVGKSYSTRHY